MRRHHSRQPCLTPGIYPSSLIPAHLGNLICGSTTPPLPDSDSSWYSLRPLIISHIPPLSRDLQRKGQSISVDWLRSSCWADPCKPDPLSFALAWQRFLLSPDTSVLFMPQDLLHAGSVHLPPDPKLCISESNSRHWWVPWQWSSPFLTLAYKQIMIFRNSSPRPNHAFTRRKSPFPHSLQVELQYPSRTVQNALLSPMQMWKPTAVPTSLKRGLSMQVLSAVRPDTGRVNKATNSSEDSREIVRFSWF